MFTSVAACGFYAASATGSVDRFMPSGFEHRLTPGAGKTPHTTHTLLQVAADQGDMIMAKQLIDAGANVNAVCKSSCGSGDSIHGGRVENVTPLHIAVRKEDSEMAKLLIKAGANVNAADKKGETPFHVVTVRGDCEMSKFMIKAGANVNATDGAGCTPLHRSSAKGDVEMASLLIDTGADVNVPCNSTCRSYVIPGIVDDVCSRGRTPLHIALHQEHPEMAKLLVKAGANVNTADQEAQTPLHLVSDKGDSDMAQLLIDAGADVNTADNKGQTPLHLVSFNGYCDMAQLLVNAGADVNAADKAGRTPLYAASDRRDCAMAKLLIKAGANANVTNDKTSSPLYMALIKGDFNMVKLLFEAGADVQLLDKDGKSALHLLLSAPSDRATPTSISKTFTLLTDAGATVDGATATISPLVPSDVIRAIVPEDTHFWLAANNDAPMLAAELAGGLDPNMKTENGMTLMHWACAGDAPECVQLLLDAGADKKAGKPTPICYCMHETSACLECMINYGADINQMQNFKYPIHFALAANSPACVTALVGAGAWVTKKEMNEYCFNTPLQEALTMRPVPVFALRALLAAAGERVLSEKIRRMPPLYWAVQYSTVDGVRVLVEGGADVKEKYADNTILEYTLSRLSYDNARPSDVSRLTAIADYLKSLPCFNDEE